MAYDLDAHLDVLLAKMAYTNVSHRVVIRRALQAAYEAGAVAGASKAYNREPCHTLATAVHVPPPALT
jgi:hypothetical protein